MPNRIPPVILVPGITASVLHDEYEMPPEAMWSTVLKRRHERITFQGSCEAVLKVGTGTSDPG